MKYTILCMLTMLIACGQVPLGTQAALNRLDPMTADATTIRFAVEQTADLPLDTTAFLRLALSTPEGEVAESFILDRVQQPVNNGAIIRTIFAIAAADQSRFNRLREEILEAKSLHPDNNAGSLSISASGCMIAPPPKGPWLVSAFIGIDGQSDWLPLIRDVDIRTLGSQSHSEAITLCR